MANLKRSEIDDQETTTQTISMDGKVRNILVKQAKDNGRSLSGEIVYRIKQSLKSEGVAL